MIVLGISALYHDSAAALVDETGIIAAAQEERFTRKKADARFPHKAIEFCLSKLGPERRLDRIAYYENPQLKAARILTDASRMAPYGEEIWPATLQGLHSLGLELPKALLGLCDNTDRISFVAHHRSHAASAFFPSPFDRAAVLIVDGVGEWSTTSIWLGEGHELTPLLEIKYPHSLGLFYSAFTQYCGFKVNSGEYKLMGLAPFGTPKYKQLIFEHLIDLKADGSFTLNLEYFAFRNSESTISPAFEALFGAPARRPDTLLDRHIMDVAASAQAVLQECMLALGRAAMTAAGCNTLCLAGGVALNCVANTYLSNGLSGLEDLWVQPAAGDAGGALGAALQVYASESKKRPILGPNDAMKDSLLGPSFSPENIERELVKSELEYARIDSASEMAAKIAKSISEGHIVGHFDGPMEFGPRALGNRSILADPRQDDALSRVNQKIKFREGWRPLAPIVLEEAAAKMFEPPFKSPYMLMVSKLKPEFRVLASQGGNSATDAQSPIELQAIVNSQFPAISHVDDTSRLQTIAPEASSRVRVILDAFFELTGCPMLLNTSFNVRGEPIVCTPRNAVDCFLNTQMDVLAIGPFFILKAEQSAAAQALVGKVVFDAD